VTSIVVALVVNILALPLQALVEKISLILNIPIEFVYALLMIILTLCILGIVKLYLGKPIVSGTTSFLLINKDFGLVYPNSPLIEYSAVGTLALKSYLKDSKAPLSLNDELIRDLLEVFIVDWLVSATVHKHEALSGFARPRIRYPKIGKHLRTLKSRDILTMFGENRFVKYLEGKHIIMFPRIKIPEKLVIECHRYKEERIELELDEEPLWVHYASELQLRGPLFAPLKRFRIILYIARIAPGEPLLLTLEYGCRDVTLAPDYIECIDRIGRAIKFAGEERKKLGSWTEVDFGIVISVEIKPWLFFHPRFYEILTWLRKLSLRAIDYFTPKLRIQG